MPAIESHYVSEVQQDLAERGFDHLRVRRRGDLLILESGPADDPVRHARLRRVTVGLWTLECATHVGQWQPTGLRDQLDPLLDQLTTTLSWVLQPRE